MQAIELDKGQPVTFKWIDSASSGGWFSTKNQAELGDASIIATRGYVVKANLKDVALVVSTSLSERGSVIDPLEIPWVAITELTIEPIV